LKRKESYVNNMESINLSSEWKKCLPNIAKMMRRRGYFFSNKMNEFSFLFYESQKNIPIILIFMFFEKVGVDQLKRHFKESFSDNVKDYIIIYQKHMTSTCFRVIKDLFQYKIDLFTLDNFHYDLTSLYYYVPHYKINSEAKKKELLDRYGNQLPIIQVNDPISRYFGYKRGDMIQIQRDKNEISYRICK
jgi:DNA-directed RNA polymerase I, II, and III subunit RPABC1